MAIRTELNLRLPNSPGALAGVCRLLSNERVNVLALSLETGGTLRMVVDNHVHGGATLREHHHDVTERDVLFVPLPNAVGALAPVLRLVARRGRQRQLRLRRRRRRRGLPGRRHRRGRRDEARRRGRRASDAM